MALNNLIGNLWLGTAANCFFQRGFKKPAERLPNRNIEIREAVGDSRRVRAKFEGSE